MGVAYKPRTHYRRFPGKFYPAGTDGVDGDSGGVQNGVRCLRGSRDIRTLRDGRIRTFPTNLTMDDRGLPDGTARTTPAGNNRSLGGDSLNAPLALRSRCLPDGTTRTTPAGNDRTLVKGLAPVDTLTRTRCLPDGTNRTVVDNCIALSVRLQNTAVPEFAFGSSTYTFVRATTATVYDFEGIVRHALSGEIRFKGARRVENLITASEDLSDAAWIKAAGGGGTIPAQVSGNTYRFITGGTAGSDISDMYQTVTLAPNDLVFSFTASSDVATDLEIFADSGGTSEVISITTTPTRYSSFAAAASGDRVYFRLAGDNAGDVTRDITITKIQVEIVTGQSNQNPSEYVSTGVLSAPFHGAGIDAVECFRTTNGNTVASNVVTEADGDALVATDFYCDHLGPFGYREEESRTNIQIRSEEFSNAAWVKINCAVDANVAIAPDGKTTADRFNVVADANVHSLTDQNTITSTGDTQQTYYVKDDGGRYISIINNLSSNNWATVTFDLVLGTKTQEDEGVTSGTINASGTGITPLPNGWFRIALNSTLGAGTVVNSVIQGSDTGTPSVDTQGQISYTPSAGEDYFIWGAMAEDNVTFPSSYIPTTTSAVIRDLDKLTYDDADHIFDGAGTAFASVSTDWAPAAALSAIIARDTNGRLLYVANASGDDQIAMFDGTATSISPAGSNMEGVARKVGSSWGANQVAYSPDTLDPDATPGAYDATMGTGDLAIGCLNTGANPLSGTIRFVEIMTLQFTDAEVITPSDNPAYANAAAEDRTIGPVTQVLIGDPGSRCLPNGETRTTPAGDDRTAGGSGSQSLIWMQRTLPGGTDRTTPAGNNREAM